MSWEVSVIFPSTRSECSELVCNRRTSHGAAGQGDRGDKEADVGVRKESVSMRKLDERKPARAAGDDAGEEAVEQRSRETTPRESLGSRWISATLESS
jgi:hypothetical protein